MICARNYKTLGPYEIKSWGGNETTGLWRVHDAGGRRITEPVPKKQARRICSLLNDVFANTLECRLTITFTGKLIDGIECTAYPSE